ncbi:rRNA maturation RNase YbeY [Lederbergia lenta]|uniref:Endoribonuclease YbeY n=1 Tax=Lederbergia lenta TaxID=1467 RepID=A0A2X4WAL2_LEDLE|nr:rRNA maturation RNase YbeY [Lederbergia lenta]MCM3111382.1 rRNA maturation RNase YbeY [Lederbergia lenta]MEC2325231.1 rRNA maturation RNase YbeY [Lederbergia lenta]SQI55922.1 putative metalloprotease [Lederbergia lenta]
MLQIDIIDETDKLDKEHVKMIEGILNYAAQKEGVEEDSEVSVTIVTNSEIQEINKMYRGKDEPTDVISFAMEELGEGEIIIKGEGIPRMLGDIIISIERAEEQADMYEHTFIRELGFLAVHGLLHLLGYDHINKEDEKKMFSRQKMILDGYGLER